MNRVTGLCLRFRVLLLAATVLPPAWGQGAAPEPIKIGRAVFSGSLRTRFEGWNWFRGEGDNQYLYMANQLRFGFSQSNKQWDWLVDFEAPILLGLPANAIAPGAQGQMGLGATHYAANDRNQNVGMLFPKQGYIRLKGLFGDDSQSLRLGRFEFMDGGEVVPKNAVLAAVKRDRINQRLIGPFGWSNVARSFDGFHYAANKAKINYTLAGAIPTRGAFQVDGWGNLKVGFLYASATGQVAGKKNHGEWRGFAIYYHDWRHVLKTDNRPQAMRLADLNNIRIGSFGGHYLHTTATAAGPLDFAVWGVLQTGRWGRLDHGSKAGLVEAGWQPAILPRLKPWIRGGWSHTQGDSNPNDQKHETFFQILPTPRPFARFPFFDMVNNEDGFVSLAVRPHKAWTIKHETHWLRLADRNDLWVLGGGAYQPWTFGYVGRPSSGSRGLANLYDVSVDYAMSSQWAFTGYYGSAIGHGVVAGLYPKGKNGRFAYLEINYKF